ncbi:hypothetical protein [Oharaeibacter diazotrophicus]|uniref:Uncharacterized protein n=1 Tax=Oharaeibacter diazotrophicus TaxID=1920512 RepID=A0A4R6RI52_9HYPH|nr:hypothetical protein [Oharaeibacter diazotrophicus]TDP86169.1 hypothetical protein EDD54_0037 [Oharaeibacter diazotrophicus]BBE71890.1 hypothetical protein OHA_1_01475 [Pleomorphomonas sp. SM30]
MKRQRRAPTRYGIDDLRAAEAELQRVLDDVDFRAAHPSRHRSMIAGLITRIATITRTMAQDGEIRHGSAAVPAEE